ncbi:MAG: AbrB/MazE/SpoVT family DNA-binding domain-containing protein [Steroidobacteraceae bacterium]
MKLEIRRIGNSLGVIVPRSMLDKWGVGEGDTLELTERGIGPRSAVLNAQQRLDELKRQLAVAVVSRCPPALIRAHSLANLHRWKLNGVWVSAYDEWQHLLANSDDGELFAVMLGRDERCNRLRQSPPYVGLLPREEVRRLNEEATR